RPLWSETAFCGCQKSAARGRSISASELGGGISHTSHSKRKTSGRGRRTGGKVKEMNDHTRGPHAAQLKSSQVSRQQLVLFERRCQTLADRVSCKQLNFVDAVDLAYDAATWSGLVDAVGDDVVQTTMANAFMKVCQP